MIRGDEKVDVLENRIRDLDATLLESLLKDRTTNKNIIWATDNYLKFNTFDNNNAYASLNEIKIEDITGVNGDIIKPRICKTNVEQKKRVKEKAEVFTPFWICNKQNNLIDNIWFGKDNVFNVENGKSWVSTLEKVSFANSNKSWQSYILDKRLEITCGEAPYLASRYDPVTGKVFKTKERIGLLDRKIRIVNENTNDDEEWFLWIKKAYQSIYGYEWQGDSLLIARENLLYTFIDYYKEKFLIEPKLEMLKEIADIISWNIWQMDGLKCVIPMSCSNIKTLPCPHINSNASCMPLGVHNCEYIERYKKQCPYYFNSNTSQCEGCKTGYIHKHNGIYCKIKDWELEEEKSIIEFHSLITKNKV